MIEDSSLFNEVGLAGNVRKTFQFDGLEILKSS